MVSLGKIVSAVINVEYFQHIVLWRLLINQIPQGLKMLLKKLKTVLTRPLASARVGGYHYSQWRGRRHLVAAGLKSELENVERKCVSTGALPPNYMELWYLYSDVRKLQPKTIFEFGSGLSTNIIAAALLRNHQEYGLVGTLFSFESEKSWFDASDDWLQPAFKDFVKLTYSPVVIDLVGSVKVFRYTNLPDISPDMVYLDGPSLTKDVRAAVNVLDIEPKLKKGFWLVIDGRRENALFLEQHFKRNYKHTLRTGFLGGAYLQRCYELQ